LVIFFQMLPPQAQLQEELPVQLPELQPPLRK
jgi:hypothetical protein